MTEKTIVRGRTARQRVSRANGTPDVYANLKTFLQRRGGDDSMEDYYGRNHYDDYSIIASRHPGHISIRYIEATGDLYAIDEAQEAISRVALLSRLQDDAGRPLPPNTVSRILQGWSDSAPQGRPISWFVERIQRALR